MTPRRAVVWSVALAAIALALYVSIRTTRDLTDFAVYRTAGGRLLEAAPLYRPEDGHFVFKYLPAFAFAMAPFARLAPETAKLLWFLLSFALLAAFAIGSIRMLPERRRAIGTVAALTLLATLRLDLRELALGQTNALFAALLLASFVAATRGASRGAGVLTGAATFVKPYALLLALWLPAAAGLAALVACALTVVAGLALPAVVYGWSGNLHELSQWLRTVTETTAPNLLLPENVSFLSVWAKWFGPGSVATGLAIAAAVATLAAGAVVFINRRDVRAPAYLEFAFLLLIIPLLTPQGWDYMLLLGTPAIALVLDRWQLLAAPLRLAVAAALVVIALPMREVLGLSVTVAVMMTGVVTLAAVVLAAALVHLRLVRAA
jgi:glycosyl transferase family 87